MSGLRVFLPREEANPFSRKRNGLISVKEKKNGYKGSGPTTEKIFVEILGFFTTIMRTKELGQTS